MFEDNWDYSSDNVNEDTMRRLNRGNGNVSQQNNQQVNNQQYRNSEQWNNSSQQQNNQQYRDNGSQQQNDQRPSGVGKQIWSNQPDWENQQQGWNTQQQQHSWDTQQQRGQQQQWGNQQWNSGNPQMNNQYRNIQQYKPRYNPSELAIIALALCFLSTFRYAAPIVAAIDLRKDNGKRHELSLVALGLSSLFMIVEDVLLIAMVISEVPEISVGFVMLMALTVLIFFTGMLITFIITVMRRGKSAALILNIILQYLSGVVLLIIGFIIMFVYI